MKIGTIALYALAGASISATLAGCATGSGQSQLAPLAATAGHGERSIARRGDIPAGSIIAGFGQGPDSFVKVYSGSSGGWKEITKITSNVVTPASMRIDRDGNLNVADYGANAVSVYSLAKNGEYVDSDTTDVATPYGLAVNGFPDLAVLNRTTGGAPRITVFPFASHSPYVIENKDFHSPTDAVYDEFGNLFVADYDANTIFEFGPEGGKVVGTITDGIDRPVGVAICHGGVVCVANELANDVTLYGYAGLFKTISTGKAKPEALLAHDVHVYVGAFSVRYRINEVIDYNLSNDTETDITDGVHNPRGLAWCDPGICVINNYDDITIYDASDKLVHTIREPKAIVRSVISVP